MVKEKGTNNVNLTDLKKELNIKCDVLIDRIKNMLEISEINGKLYEKEKCFVFYNEDYYKNRELKRFVDDLFLKFNNETIGKILALYDSCIKNRTLNVNLLEIQNRIKDLKNFDEKQTTLFKVKVKELQIQVEYSKDYQKTLKSINIYIDVISEIPHAGSRITVALLKDPFIVNGLEIYKLEISEPKPKRIVTEKDFDHMAFVVKDNFENWRDLEL